MTVSLVAGIFAVLFAYLARNKGSEKLLFVSFAVLIVIGAIRYAWGPDYFPYLEFFEQANSAGVFLFDFKSIKDVSNHGEYGWTYFNVLCGPIGYFGLVIIITLFQNIILYLFVKKYVPRDWWWFSILIYVFIAKYFLIGGCSMYRQWTAACIFIIAMNFIAEKKTIPYILLILAASYIHRSALILLPLYFYAYLGKRQQGIGYMIAIIVAVIIAGRILPILFSDSLNAIFSVEAFEDYELYLRDEAAEGQTNIVGAISLYVKDYILPLIGYYFLSKEDDVRLRVIGALSLTSLFVIPLSQVIPMANRLVAYFYIFNLAVCPLAISRLYNNNKSVALSILAIFLLFTFREFFSFFSTMMGEYYNTYQTIFSVPWQ